MNAAKPWLPRIAVTLGQYRSRLTGMDDLAGTGLSQITKPFGTL